MAVDTHEDRTAGILWMLATMFCFITLDAIMKHLLESYSLVQVTWGRFFFATIVAALACGRRISALAVSRAPKQQALRSVVLMSTTGLFNAGIRTIPLATATTIMFLSPILVTLLSIPLLGEKVRLRRWIGMLIGFTGAVIVVRPWQEGLGGLGLGVLFLLAAAFLNANYQIITRKVRLDDPLTSLLYTAAAGAIVTSLMVPWFWTWPDVTGWLMFALCGLAGGLGHLFLIRAFRAAPASVVAPFSYSSLVWATLYGFVVWGDWPDMWTWAGAALIIGSGLYIYHRERMRHEDR
ncbi:MAG: DMT family transporter [Alphaproteobacteria bacterium]|nr:DMT family transporter [Alphaproteobacteria bacterium]